MRKIYKLAAIACLGLMLPAQNIQAQTVSDFENLALSPNTYWDGSDMSGVHNNFQFSSTFLSGDGIFPNVYDTTYGAIYGYMASGFAYSNQEDSSTAGSSFSSYAYGTTMGNNYAIGKDGSSISLTGSTSGTTLTGVYVTNSTYAGISMRDGDYFGKVFGDSMSAAGYGPVNDGTNGEDWFLLSVHGFLNGNPTANSVDFYLADFRFANNAQDYILNTWEWVDLTPLGNVDSVVFSLSSSDTTGGFGMNTPNFFAFDDFNGVGPNSINQLSIANELVLYPNPTNNVLNIKLTDEVSSLFIIDVTGKEVTSYSNLNKGVHQINVSDLSNGIYFVRTNNTSKRFIKF